MKKTTQSSSADLEHLRKRAGLLLNGEGQTVVRNLEFYRRAEQHLFANRNPYWGGGIHLSPLPSER